jgi:cytochrome P450
MPRQDLPPGPRAPSLIQGIGLWNRPLAYPERLRARYGKRFTVRFPFSPPFVILSDPDEIKQVFQAPPDVLHPGEGARVLEPIVGSNSLILLDEDPHMEQRKLLLPAFHGERMEGLRSLMAEVTEAEVGGWEGELELAPRMQRLTLEIILRAVFGLDPGPRLDALRERLARMLAFGDRPISLMPPDPESVLGRLLERLGPLAEFRRHQQEADLLIRELIDERRAGASSRDDVLSMLLEARHEDGSPMSEAELRDELLTLLVAGHETTASALAWTFEALLHYPRVLERLRDELDDPEERYLTATIREALRRRPVLPNVEPRLVKRPIEIGGRSYPPGCCLVPNGYLVHHDPEIYSEPYRFRPERFLDRAPGTYTWLPFGGGRRRCIGAGFALVEMAVVIRAVLGRYELALAAGRGFVRPRRRNIAVRPGDGTRIAVGARTAGARPAAAA